jgi:MYXO-CTERM domain-containing protein
MCSCVPDCEGKQCGDDGCGGVCAECAAGSSCDANFTCAPDPVEPDVVTGGDVPVGGDVTVGEDTGTTDEGGGGSDCSVAGTGAPSAAALVAGLLLALAAFRRRMA